MKHCDILDLAEIVEEVGDFEWVRFTLLHPEHYWFRLGNLFAHVERIGLFKYTLHTFGHERVSLETKRTFFINVGIWILDNTDCTTLCIFAPEEHKALRLMLRTIKEPTCYIPNGHGEGKGEYMYTFDKEDRRKLCHKQYQ